MYETDELVKEIEILRNKMIKVATEKGFTDEESIKISQELDRLINCYNKTRINKRYFNKTLKNKV